MTFTVNGQLLNNRYISTAILSPNNSLYSFGLGSGGQTGLNTTTNYSSPVQVGALSNWGTVSAPGAGSSGDTLSIKNNNTLWSWGDNTYGQLGLNTSTSYSSPVQVGALSTWTQIACGYAVGARQNNGTLWTWGYNFYGQLGQSDTTNRSSPVQVGALTTWTNVSSGRFHILALQNPGTLWAWGLNSLGQLGISNQTNYYSPVQVGTLNYWTQIAAGNGWSTALQSNGTLWSSGDNGQGQLGINSTTSSVSSPVQAGTISSWTQVACGYYFVAALQSNGTLWTWGSNSYNQLGLNTSTLSRIISPVQVGALSAWSQFSCGRYHMLALQNNGTLWAWGNNNYGQLGTSDQTNYSSPVQIGTLNKWNFVTCGYSYTTAQQIP